MKRAFTICLTIVMLLSLSACDLTAVLSSGETVEMNYDYEQMEENLRKMREEDGVYIEMSIVNLETGETPTAEKLVYAQTPNAFYYCGDTGEEGPSGTKKPDPSPDSGGTTKPSQGTQIPLPQGWNENNYGAYIYEVWDSQFLPDCFPESPAGIAVEQTVFKNYNHDRINQKYAVGPLFYENKEDYREYGVGFYGDLEHLQAFVAAVEAKGMTGGQTEDGDWLVYNYYGNGWFMEVFAKTQYSSEAEYAYYISVSATDSLFALPEAVDGIPLPQAGMTEQDYNEDFYIIDFSNGYDERTFDLSKDSLPQEYYVAWFTYYGTVNQQAIDYARQRKSQGWEVEWESDGDDGFRCCLKKGDIYMVVNYYAYECMIEVGFSDMVENLSY